VSPQHRPSQLCLPHCVPVSAGGGACLPPVLGAGAPPVSGPPVLFMPPLPVPPEPGLLVWPPLPGTPVPAVGPPLMSPLSSSPQPATPSSKTTHAQANSLLDPLICLAITPSQAEPPSGRVGATHRLA